VALDPLHDPDISKRLRVVDPSRLRVASVVEAGGSSSVSAGVQGRQWKNGMMR